MSQKTINILLVEDNPDHADLLLYSLKKSGIPHTIVHKENGEEALAYLKQCQPPNLSLPDLIFLDIKLPKIDGEEVLNSVVTDRFLQAIPVVMVSTTTADQEVTRFLQLGARHFLSKPVSEEDIQSTLHLMKL